MAHPLYGADIATLTRVMSRSGLPSRPLTALGFGASAMARWPFSTAERIWLETRLPPVESMAPPVFIVGHWRSGTTHLYNIMTRSGRWAYVPPVATGMPWDLFGLAAVLRPVLERALPRHRYIDNIPVTPDSPQEDEIALANMSETSFYHGIYFPSDFADHLERGLFFTDMRETEIQQWEERFVYLMRKLYLYHERRPLLIKNPVYTARVGQLKRLFPTAKFIHIHRNPYDVFRSMQNFYNKLLAQFATQSYDHVDIDETILSVYPRMMDRLWADVEQLNPEDYIEVAYNDLDADPLAVIENIYAHLRLDGFAGSRPAFEQYLGTIQSFEKNRFDRDPALTDRVETRWRRYIDHYGYERPETRIAA